MAAPSLEESPTRGARGGVFDQPSTMALVLGALYLAGATIGAASLILPHPDSFETGALWGNTALACAGGVLLVVLRRRLPVWVISLSLLIGTVLITRAVFFGNDPSGYYTLWYLWIGVYAFFFFGMREGLAQVGAIGVAYGWVLIELDDTTPVVRWVVMLGGIVVIGLLVDTLGGRLRRESATAATRAANLEAVHEVARQLAIQSDPRAVGWAICTAAVKASGAAAAVLWRPAPTGSELVATATAGVAKEGARLPFVTPGSGAIRAFTAAERRFSPMEDQTSMQELGPELTAVAALWQPVLRDEGAAVGVLAVYWTEAVQAAGEETRRAIRLLALEAAIAFERGELLGRLEQAARTDDLTGLLNRRAWNEELGRELSRASRDGRQLAVAILDLDRFKQYNDTHGHLAGDRFLKQTASSWIESLRSTDVLARYGGEEFALAMPGTTLEEAERLLKRLCEPRPEGQTCSAGVCIWDGSESAEALIARADAALYAAKEAGRDKVMTA